MALEKLVNGIRVPLTEAEIAEFNQRQVEHEAMLVERAKTQYLKDREAEYPSINEMVLALWENALGDSTAFNLLEQKRLGIKAKYPKPE